jgi:RNA polymerase sigma-70 factor (ECF subfamily)
MPRDAVAQALRGAHGPAVATLARVLGDLTFAEDAVQDAVVAALRRWPVHGIPDNPTGWIVTTARNRAVDELRRVARGRQLATAVPAAGDPDELLEATVIRDDQLRLIFTCCHPALRVEHQVALTLRLVGGLGVDQVARGFLVSESTMSKRIVRAKAKIKAAHIPYRVPTDAELPGRLRSALSVLYLIYNAGADHADGTALRTEAVRLGRVLVDLMPDEPEVWGLLALMLLCEARAPAQVRPDDVVLLREQDRTRWDRALIREGHQLVRRCITRNQPGPFQLQAAIHAVHCDAARFEDTDWSQIVSLYDLLYQAMPTPVVAVNRAIAQAETAGPDVALAQLDALATDLPNYHLRHAARAIMLRGLDREDEAVQAFDRAIELAPDPRSKRVLLRQRGPGDGRVRGEEDGPTSS